MWKLCKVDVTCLEGQESSPVLPLKPHTDTRYQSGKLRKSETWPKVLVADLSLKFYLTVGKRC